jgi:hypothetical protein
MSGYGTIDLGNGESVEATPAFWSDSERLRYAAQRLQAKSTAPPRYPVMSTAPDTPAPRQRSIADQIPNTPLDEEAERRLRTSIAMGEIQRALRAEEQQAEAEKARARQQAETAFNTTPMGRLLRRW